MEVMNADDSKGDRHVPTIIAEISGGIRQDSGVLSCLGCAQGHCNRTTHSGDVGKAYSVE